LNRQERVDALWPLVDRCHLGHCWIRTSNGPRLIREAFTPGFLNEHATGSNVYGLCPIAPGSSTTRVACLDFDSHKGETPWPDMMRIVDTVVFALETEGYAPVVFRSSGGSGVHLYLVWDAPQDARSVREMLRVVLDACGFTSGTAGVSKGQVEVFPKQDEVPADGYGSMFVLPLSPATQSELISGELWAASPDAPVVERLEKAAHNAIETPQSLTRIKSALDAIPNSGEKELSYDEWFRVVCAIHHATDGSVEGLHQIHEFSQRASKYDGDFIDNRVWPYIRSDRDGDVITERSLFTLASRYGWQDTEVLDAFEELPVTAGGLADQKGIAGDRDPQRFQVKGAAEARNQKPLSWFVKGVIPRAELIMVYGESGSGKTFLVTDIAAAIARGIDWRGHRTRQARVVYVAAEGAAGFGGRISAYCGHHHCELDGPEFGYIGTAPNLLRNDDVTDLIQALRSWGGCDIVVIDTFARVMPGGNENASEDVGKALAHCKTIHEVTGASVVLVHHSGKDSAKGARGWSGIRAAVDAELEVVRSGEDRAVTVSKLKDGQDGAQFGFKLLTVPLGLDDDGDVVSSCVIEHTEGGVKQKAKLGVNQKAVMDALPTLGQDGVPPTVDELLTRAIDFVPFDKGSGKRDRRRELLFNALQKLVAEGFLAYEEGRVVPS